MKIKYVILSALLVSQLTACLPKKVSMNDGKYLQVTNKHTEAIAHFEKYLAENPSSPYAPEAQYLVGESYERLNQYNKALTAYNTVLKKNPKSPYAALSLRRMAKYYEQQKDYENAIKHYEQAMDVLRTDANIEQCLYNLGQLYQDKMKNNELALKEYHKIITRKEVRNPRILVNAYFNTGEIYKAQGKYEKSQAAFKTITDKYSWSSKAPKAKEELQKIKNLSSGSGS